jgi:hypothetical protein
MLNIIAEHISSGVECHQRSAGMIGAVFELAQRLSGSCFEFSALKILHYIN